MTSLFSSHKLVLGLIGLLIISIGFVMVEFVLVKYGGTPVLAPKIPRDTEQLGTGPAVTYVVMGDSTSIGQGSDYADSIGVKTADYLAQSHTISYTNVGISGATVKTVLSQQLTQAEQYKPDVVLLAVGANDATHLRSGSAIKRDLTSIINGLVSANCNVKIVLTGSPDVGSVPRFPWPLKEFMGLRTRQVNTAITSIITAQQLTFAPIAEKTGPTFASHPEYFAVDKFHPLARGYAIWLPVLYPAIDQALQSQPSHCQATHQ